MHNIEINPYERVWQQNKKTHSKVSNICSLARLLLKQCPIEKLKIYLPIVALVFMLKPFVVAGVFSFANFLTIASMLFVAIHLDTNFTVVTGVVLGSICALGNPDAIILIGVLGFCGLCAGIGGKFKLLGATFAFIASHWSLMWLSEGMTYGFINVYEILVATIFVAFFPKKISSSIVRELIKTEKKNKNVYKAANIVTEKLHEFSSAFSKLAEAFSKIVEKNKGVNYNDIASMFDTVAEKVCSKCPLCMVCWEKEFNNTYQIMFKILSLLEMKNKLSKEDIPEYFANKCQKIDAMVEQLNATFEIYKNNNIWIKRNDENRDIITLQFKSFSDIINKLIKDIDGDLAFDVKSEGLIKEALKENGIEAIDVTATKDYDGRYTVETQIKKCHGKGCCSKLLKPTIKNVLNRNIKQHKRLCNDNCPVCNLKFTEKEKFGVTVGIASKGASTDGQSGDNYSLLNLENGKYAVIISDGVGIGETAAKESLATTELLRGFLEIGFEKMTALKLINSIMMIKSAKETFATVDLCVFDLYNGEAELVKMGAAPTYVKKREGAEIINSFSLPVGIISEINIERIKLNFDVNDSVIMISDGVESKNNDNCWLKNFINNATHNLPPQALAEQILSRAVAENNDALNDDMTIIVVRIDEAICDR